MNEPLNFVTPVRFCKAILITYRMFDFDRDRFITFLSSEMYFEKDVNNFVERMRSNQRLLSLITYNFDAPSSFPKVLETWSTLVRNRDFSWTEKIERMKALYPNGKTQELSV